MKYGQLKQIDTRLFQMCFLKGVGATEYIKDV